MMLSNLYDKVLMEPWERDGANELFVVSGYASATFTHRHLKDLIKTDNDKCLNLIIGMPSKRSDHQGFIKLLGEHPDNFRGYYYNGRPAVHCKSYSWFQNDHPISGFTGSANYSQSGFTESMQANQIVEDNPSEIKRYYLELLATSIAMQDLEVDTTAVHEAATIHGSLPPGQIDWIIDDRSVRISFLSRDGSLPEISGLNWGQRQGREANQAYLSIRTDATKIGFLPEKGATFTMLTDDGEVFDCTVQQDGRKAISTTDNNSILGRYIRRRLNLDEGVLVTADDLIRYGRTDFTLEKLEDETFYFDMSIL